MKLTLSNVSSKYGAPIGRANTILQTDIDYKFRLYKLEFVDYCYDSGGAYWGMGNPIYRAIHPETGNEMFVRAANRQDAKNQVRETFPKAKFYI